MIILSHLLQSIHLRIFLLHVCTQNNIKILWMNGYDRIFPLNYFSPALLQWVECIIISKMLCNFEFNLYIAILCVCKNFEIDFYICCFYAIHKQIFLFITYSKQCILLMLLRFSSLYSFYGWCWSYDSDGEFLFSRRSHMYYDAIPTK